MMETVDGRLIVIGGASRSGKTAYVVKAVAKEKRIIAWDPEDQFSRLRGWRRITSRADLLKAIQTDRDFKIGFVAGGNLTAEFDFWAGCVQYCGRHHGPLSAIAEELSDVTTTAKAPGNWGILLRRGLKRGITIYAISQRWQEADKTAINNASMFVLFRHNGEEAPLYLKRKTGVPVEQIPTIPLEYVIFNPTTREISKNKLRF